MTARARARAGRYVALLRGINVGTAKRVAMADLRALVEGLGYRDVATLLNSGNVVFTAPASVRGDPATRIEAALAARLRVTSRVTVLTDRELAQAVDDNPFLEVATDPSRFLVAVLRDPETRKHLEPFSKRDWKPEAFGLGKRVAYLWCPNGILKSPVGEAVNRALGDGVTARNWSTLTKLHALARG